MGVQFYRDKDLPYFELKQCDTSQLSYKKHAHEEYSLGIVDKGKSSFWYEGKSEEVSPRTIVFIPPDLVHSCNPEQKEQWKYNMLFINAAWIDSFMNSEAKDLYQYPVVKNISDPEIFSMTNKMIENLVQNASPLEKEESIIAIFEKIVSQIDPVDKGRCKKELPKLQIIKEYLQSNFFDKITLDLLEKVSGINKFHIIRLFKEEFGIPPHMYQTLLRINYAKKQLRKQRQITDVALEAGFYDQSHFSKVFKSHMGITPDRYEKLI
ncbi:AraC family transcriptional regulator [Pelosinus sp. IPA-1]|uniref:AraC family transcriptional regulator n=1 Tax=Pelosinus sp. IPA-1 TaxID=3029569 RepID=UPI0024362965|nr:AraC family transcriptional regulator [Pelosinus sp. IPA-1]GMA97372.1 AraC family transcriptional regulator [Pelosinus sp. IPA-1]